MGFNKRKLEDQRREAADKEAASRRATDAQVLEDAERLITAWNERQALCADDLFAHDRRRYQGGLLVPVGPLPGVPNDQRNRLAHARSPSRRGRDEPHSRAVMPIMSAERAVRRASAAIADEHRRRNARGTSAESAWRVIAIRNPLTPNERLYSRYVMRWRPGAGCRL